MKEQRTNRTGDQSRQVINPYRELPLILENNQFDRWMTRQLNCLMGRYIAFVTPNSAGSRFNDRTTVKDNQ